MGARRSVALKAAAARVQATKEQLLGELAYLETRAKEEGDEALSEQVHELHWSLVKLGVGNVLKSNRLIK